MATKAGDIYIEVTAEFAKINDQLTKLNGMMRQFGESSKSHFQLLGTGIDIAKNALQSFGIALSVGALAAYTKHLISPTVELGNLAEQIGVNVESLQELSQIGQEFGLTSDQIAAGLERLTRSIGEAAGDNTALAKTFDELGISVRDTGNNIRSNEDVLYDFADAMAAIPDAATRATYENDLLGKGAQKLDPILRQGSGRLRELMQAAKDAGTIIGTDDVNALREMSRATDDAKDRINANAAHMIASWEDVWNWILRVTAATQDLAKANDQAAATAYKMAQVTDAARQVATLQEQIRQVQAGATPNKFGGMIAQHTDLGALNDELAKAQAHLRALGGPGRTTPYPVPPEIPRDLISPPVGATKEGGGSRSTGQTEAQKQADAIAKVVEQLQFENEQLGLSNEAQQVNTALRQAGTTIDTQQGQQIAELVHLNTQQTEQLAEQNKLDEDAKKLKEALLTPQEKNNQLIADYNKLLAAQKINQTQYNAAVGEAAKAMQDADPAYQKAIAEQKELQSAVTDAAGAILTDLGRAFTDSGTAADRWKNFVSHAIQDVMSVLDGLLKKVLGGALDSLFGGATLGSIFGGSGIGGGVGGTLADAVSIPGLASGGSMGVGDWAIVGEAGPELVYADTPGNVLSASRTRGIFGSGGGGSGDAHFHIDARGADMGAVARMEIALRELHRTFDQRAVAAVAGQRSRGGSFAATFSR